MDLPVPDSARYFITADASYCHILPDRVILTSHATYRQLPPSVDKKNMPTLLLGGFGIVFGTFLMANFFIVGMYLMGILLLFAMSFATKALVDVSRYSGIENISRDRIEEVTVSKPSFGYLYAVFRFRNDRGSSSLRKVKFYDSRQNELHAMELLRREGLIS